MVGEQVLLSVPSVEVVTRAGAPVLIRERESGELVAVRQDFEGVFSGRALLIFPQVQQHGPGPCRDRRRAVGAKRPIWKNEALAETGNVVLNSCLATMANMLQRPLTMSLPEVHPRRWLDAVRHVGPNADGGVVLFLYINFAINDRDIRGYIAMLMDLPSLQALKALIADFIERVVGDVA
jgi:chemotaxis protein CheC